MKRVRAESTVAGSTPVSPAQSLSETPLPPPSPCRDILFFASRHQICMHMEIYKYFLGRRHQPPSFQEAECLCTVQFCTERPGFEPLL